METAKKMPAIVNNLEEVLMPVQTVKTESLFMDNTLKVDSGKEFSVIRESKILGLVSKNFNVIQPSEFHQEMTNIFDVNNIKVNPTGKIDNIGNWEIRYTFEETWKENRKSGDEIKPFVSFSNGLAGSKSGNASGGALRLVCTNGMTSQIQKAIFAAKVRNTSNTQKNKLGIDFDILFQKYLRYFESFEQVQEEQLKLIDQEFKIDQLLPVFYEATKGTNFPMYKYQDAFDRIAFEAKELGYTQMNKYLAYAGLNYILEHDSQQLNLNKVKEIDTAIVEKINTLSIPQAMKNFNAMVREETERIETYKAENDGKEPRGKRKIIELDLSAWS